MSKSFKLIVISAEVEVDNEVQLICEFFNYGLNYFHIRRYKWDEQEMATFIRSIPVEFHNKIIIHSNYGLVERFAIKGIHLNSENRLRPKNFDIKQVVSTSFHLLEEIENVNYPYEYVFLSPVFDSISKPTYKSRFNLELAKTHFQYLEREKIQTPEIIALGGIEINNIMAIKEAGFAGAALLGVVWNSKNPVNAFKEVQLKIC